MSVELTIRLTDEVGQQLQEIGPSDRGDVIESSIREGVARYRRRQAIEQGFGLWADIDDPRLDSDEGIREFRREIWSGRSGD